MTPAAKPPDTSNMPSKPKNTLKHFNKFNDPSGLQINYRYFNDWRSHIIYYKQIKGYSHNQHLNAHMKLNRSSLSNLKKSPSFLNDHTRSNIETKDKLVYSLNSVSERNLEKSFHIEHTQSGIFSKKVSGSYNSVNSQINNITAQNQCAVQYANKLNNLNHFLSSPQVNSSNNLTPGSTTGTPQQQTVTTNLQHIG